MELKDFIQYYLHCEFYLTKRKIKTRITNYWPQQDNEHCIGYGIDGFNGVEDIKYIKPILRKLEDITDEEFESYINLKRLKELYVDVFYKREEMTYVVKYAIETPDGYYPQIYDGDFLKFDAYQLDWLHKHSFDMYELINSGQAIDAKTLK